MEDCINEILEDTSDTDCSDDEDGPYIELELDTEPPTCYDDELRISISSAISVILPEVQKESTTVLSSELKVDEIERTCYADSQGTMPLQHSGVSQTDEAGFKVQFPDENQLFSTVSFNPRPRGLWEIPRPDTQTILGTSSTRMIHFDNVDLYASRKQPSLSTTATNGIMMKLLIKFRGTKIGALFASLIKPRQPCQVINNVHKPSKKSKTFFQCYEQTGRTDQVKRSKRSCREMEMDLGALRGAFNAMGIMSIGKRGSCRSKRSTSCNTSPIHDEGFSSLCSHHENSIQAAISYCKSSLDQTSDFTFTSSITSTPSRRCYIIFPGLLSLCCLVAAACEPRRSMSAEYSLMWAHKISVSKLKKWDPVVDKIEVLKLRKEVPCKKEAPCTRG